MPRRKSNRRPAVISETVETQAERLLTDLGIHTPPIPIERVASRLGLQVERTTFGDDVSGVLVIDDGRGVIGVNVAHAPARQRFTIAHEIGHYVLHRDELPVFIDKQMRQYLAVFRDEESTSGEDIREREANGFAAALLMPARLLREEVARLRLDLEDEESVGVLARRFKVSHRAMDLRLLNIMGTTSWISSG